MISLYSSPWRSCYLLDSSGVGTIVLVQILFLSPGKILKLLVTEYVLYSHSVQGHSHVGLTGFFDVLLCHQHTKDPMVGFLKTVILVLEATSIKQQLTSKGQYFLISNIQFNTNNIDLPVFSSHLSSEVILCWPLAGCL